MQTEEIILPNSVHNFLLKEMSDRLRDGLSVKIAFGGNSMLPLIDGHGDKIVLRPLERGERCVPGEVYIFIHQGHYVVHRLMRYEGDVLLFRGDNCFFHERVPRTQVLAKLVRIEHPDGAVTECESAEWRKRSRRVVRRRNWVNRFRHIGNIRRRKICSVVYFILLLLLMWAPVGGLGIPLDNFVFGLRTDHLLHASVYLFCAFFLFDWLRRRPWPILLLTLLVGIVTESVQYLLPYRGFDVNDLAANFLGGALGWSVLMLAWRIARKKNRQKGSDSE